MATAEFTYQDYGSLFGLGLDVGVHQEKLDAAVCFQLVRKSIERQRTRLHTLDRRGFMRRPEVFRSNVDRALNDPAYATLLKPLCSDVATLQEVNRFFLVCSLSLQNLESLLKHGLAKVFLEVFPAIAGQIIIPKDTTDAMLEVTGDVCKNVHLDVASM